MTTERAPMFCESCRAVTTFLLTYSDTERTPAGRPVMTGWECQTKGHTPIARSAFRWSWEQ